MKSTTTNIWSDLLTGFKTVAASPWLWVTILVAALANMVDGGAVTTSLPFLVSDSWKLDVKSLGFVYSALSVGAVLMALIMGNTRKLHKRGYVAYASWFMIGAMIVLMGIQRTFSSHWRLPLCWVLLPPVLA
jgi:hypothetical protein